MNDLGNNTPGKPSQLIPLSQAKIGNETIETVNARELHAFLEVKTRFNDWIKNRIKEYGFVENVDFVTLTENLVSGGQRQEYFLTLDMGKEISMVERNAKGKEARKYFIACEKQAKQPLQLNDPAFLRGTLLVYTEKVIELEARIEEAQPKLEALSRIANAEGSLCVTDAAKSLQMRPKDLFTYLQSHGWIYKRTGCAHYLGYQRLVVSGMLEHKVTTVLRADGSEKITEQVRITAKGLAKLAQIIKPFGVAA